ncbi:MAG: amino acid--tRNA ligase-related protein [Candidatus Saccharimonadales bacterium]|jgi:lysyl-tRNA synthetase class 2
MATLKELREERLRKLEDLKALGINAYPADAHRTHDIEAVHQRFGELEGQTVSIVGRITSIRKFGKLAFIVIKDATDSHIQLFIRAEDTPMAADRSRSQLSLPGEIGLLDPGDFVEATGDVMRTQTGEESVQVREFRLLTKSLRPMPTTQDGFTDKEHRLRRRYVDMNVNLDVRQRFIRRSKFWRATREFLQTEGFIEINNAVLENTAGGADANPFVTHMDALDQDFYLRISHELPLKRLLVAGFEKVFDIGPRFRNENYTEEHLPEHNAMEWYWAYADWEMGMELTERMIRAICDATWGTREFTLADGQVVNFGADGEHWPRISFVDILRDQYDIDVFESSMDDIRAKLRAHKLEVEKADNRIRSLDKLWKNYRKTLAGPAYLIDIPVFMQPLAKVQRGNDKLTEQFNLVFGGSEMCKAFSELNDPVDQLGRFMEQQGLRDAGDDEAQMLDIDYVEALEYGMPPACGLGFSERIFWSLEGVTAREGVPFPQLRREVDDVTKGIYPDLTFDAAKHRDTIDRSKLPVSAVTEGTEKLYLRDFGLLEADAVITTVLDEGEGTVRLELDRSCFYPGGGGQNCDTGKLSWDGGQMTVESVSKDKAGVISHEGVVEGNMPTAGGRVHMMVGHERRLLNSRLHCAGHLLDLALQRAGKNWKPGRGAHYPDMTFVEYSGDFNADESEALKTALETELATYIAVGGPVVPKEVASEEARSLSKYIPEFVLDSYQNLQITSYPGNFNICCGGTHVQDVKEVGQVTVAKIKKKDGNIRVSYRIS